MCIACLCKAHSPLPQLSQLPYTRKKHYFLNNVQHRKQNMISKGSLHFPTNFFKDIILIKECNRTEHIRNYISMGTIFSEKSWLTIFESIVLNNPYYSNFQIAHTSLSCCTMETILRFLSFKTLRLVFLFPSLKSGIAYGLLQRKIIKA